MGDLTGQRTDALDDASLPGDDPRLATTAAGGASPAQDHAGLDERLVGRCLDFYMIIEPLGAGAMGRVYRAWNTRLQRVCAVKVISPDLARMEPDRLDLFWREARAAAKLNHPNVVSVHLLGEADGVQFIEQEFVDGGSLGRRLHEQGKLSALEATRHVRAVASALREAHAHNLLHCDVKPDNVMLTGKLKAKLGDFGLAKVFGGALGARKTVGTPYFMAPELFAGKDSTVATDAYALGVTYYALLTGQVPYPARTMRDLKEQLLFADVPKASAANADVPEALCGLVRRMLAKAPEDRPALDDTLLDELSALVSQLRPLSDIIVAALQGTEVVWQQLGPDRFTFLVPLPDGRRQTIEAESLADTAFGHPVLALWTPCAPARLEDYAYVLELNGRLPHGGIGIHAFEGRPHFAMTCNLPRATLDPGEVRVTVMKLAEWADAVEQLLTGRDKF
jgi:serine/threonine-protein kinase